MVVRFYYAIPVTVGEWTSGEASSDDSLVESMERKQAMRWTQMAKVFSEVTL